MMLRSNFGLKTQIELFAKRARQTGLHLKFEKARILNIKHHGKIKKTLPQTDSNFNINGNIIEFISYTNTVKYMRVTFNSSGIARANPSG